MWNTPDPVEPWELELAGIDPDRKGLDHSAIANPRLPFPRAETQTATFPWRWETTPDQWRSYLATHSAVAAMADAERASCLDASDAIVARVCADTGCATASVRHQAFCLRWRPS